MFEEEQVHEEETIEEEIQEENQEVHPAEENDQAASEEEPAAMASTDEQPEHQQSQQMTPEFLQAVQNQMFRQMVGNIPNPETGRPFENPAEFARWREKAEAAQRARQSGMTPEQYQRVMDEATQQVKQSDPEYLRMQAMVQQMQSQRQQEVFAQDLAAIKAAYPDEQAKSVVDLGDDFMQLMATGQLDAVGAYEAVRRKRNAGRKQTPSMGAVSSGSSEPKTYYTREEVARMQPDEVEKNLDAINKSMKRWK